MCLIHVLLLLIALPYTARAQNMDYDDKRINCTLRFFPSNNSDSHALKTFQEVPILYNSKTCSSNPFRLSKGRKGAQVVEGKVSCAGTARVGIQAEFTEQIAIQYFQIRCVAEDSLGLTHFVKLPFYNTIEYWKGREVFGTMEQVWTAQLFGHPLHRGDWSTDRDHEWSLSNTYVAYSNVDKHFIVFINLSLRPNLSNGQGNLPMHPDVTFRCGLTVSNMMKDNETLSWKRAEGLSIKNVNPNCEVNLVNPAEDVNVAFLRTGGMYGEVSCIGAGGIEMIANYPEETRVSQYGLTCFASFPIDVQADKALRFRTAIRFKKFQIHGNIRYKTTLISEPGYTEAWIVNDEFQHSSLSNEYTFYSILDPTVNITISLAFQSTENKSKVHNASVSELHISGGNKGSLACSSTDSNDPPLYFVAAGGDNPSESRGLIKCLQSENIGDCAGDRLAGLSISAVQQQLPLQKDHGVVYCSSKEKQTWLEYFTPITTMDVSDNMSLIWVDENVIHLQADDEEETFFVPLPNGSSILAQFYETQAIYLECHILTYILQQRLFWWVAYANGTEQFYLNDGTVKMEMKQSRDFPQGKSVYVGSEHVKLIAEFGMNAIGCGATYWNNARNATAIFPLQIKGLSETTAPGFFAAGSIHHVKLGGPLHLNCLIDFGEPEPVYWWAFHGKNKGLKYDLFGYPQFNRPFNDLTHAIREGKTESNLTIQVTGEEMEGDYVCVAVNVRGNSSHRFKVVVDQESNSTKNWIYTGVIVGIVAFIGAVVAAVIRKLYFRRGQLSQLEIKRFENGNKDEVTREKFAHENAQFMPYDRKYEIDWEDFEVFYHEKLGEGAYGVVFKGHMAANAGRTVAFKTLKAGADKSVLLALLSELKVMIHLDGHENIVKLFGACTSFLKDGRVYLLVEFCPTGSLESYVRKIDKNTFKADRAPSDRTNSDAIQEWGYDNLGTLSIKDLIGWGIQIARGMQHLQSKKVIHGDLAARNILLYSKSQVKLTDFGLSRQLLNYDNYVKKSKAGLPWRWLALETLKSLTFTHKSDVWGYGVTLWEIFTLGLVPYPGMAWTTEFVTLLEQNLRLHRPQFASENLYKIMYRCWDAEPGNRPDFQDLEHLLLNLDD